MTYTTQTEAQIFCNLFNRLNGKGRIASFVRMCANQYVVNIKECPTWEQHFLGGK